MKIMRRLWTDADRQEAKSLIADILGIVGPVTLTLLGMGAGAAWIIGILEASWPLRILLLLLGAVSFFGIAVKCRVAQGREHRELFWRFKK